MFALERQSEIMALLTVNKSLQVQDTARRFGVTEETIRRDLNALEKQGLLIRTHGGALLPDDSLIEAPLRIREGINITGKDAIGIAAARMIRSGDSLILDASTSALYVAKHLKTKSNITVITNAERIINELVDCPEITLISTGGVLRHKSRSYTGRAAENVLSTYYADYLFFSCKGFSPSTGLTDSSEQESEIRKVMLRRARRRVFLCDHTKLDRVGFSATAVLQDIHRIITDRPLPPGWEEQITAAGIETCVAQNLETDGTGTDRKE